MSRDLESAAAARGFGNHHLHPRFLLQLDGDGTLARLQEMSQRTGFQLAAAFARASSCSGIVPEQQPHLVTRPGSHPRQRYHASGMIYNQPLLSSLSQYRNKVLEAPSCVPAVPMPTVVPRLDAPGPSYKAADLSLSLGPPSSSSSASSSPRAPRAPVFSGEFTMFYNGEVQVYEDMALDKAQAIMLLAGSVSSGTSVDTADAAINLLLAANNSSQTSSSSSASDHSAALPQARKASLSRFLEKRKTRCAAAAPYPRPILKTAADAVSAKNHTSPEAGVGKVELMTINTNSLMSSQEF